MTVSCLRQQTLKRCRRPSGSGPLLTMASESVTPASADGDKPAAVGTGGGLEPEEAKAAHATGAVLAEIPRSWKLSFMPHSGIVGSYGGGADMATANQVSLLRVVGGDALLPTSLKERVVDAVREVLAAERAIPATERVRDLPVDAALSGPDDLSWEVALHVSGPVIGQTADGPMNMMWQGWLFHEVPEEDGALGRGLYPLCGLFDGVGLMTALDSGGAGIGMNSLVPADQHVHLVDDGAWHVGSDMARFQKDPSALAAGGLCHAWAVCVDVAGKRAEVQLLVLSGHEHEDELERAFRKATADVGPEDPKDGAQVLACLRDCSCITPQLIHKLTALLEPS